MNITNTIFLLALVAMPIDIAHYRPCIFPCVYNLPGRVYGRDRQIYMYILQLLAETMDVVQIQNVCGV